jgi:hypothetical protein
MFVFLNSSIHNRARQVIFISCICLVACSAHGSNFFSNALIFVFDSNPCFPTSFPAFGDMTMDLKQINEQKQVATAEERLRKKNLQALEQAALEERTLQEKEREERELAWQIQNENKPLAALSFGGIIAKKRRRQGKS